MSSAQTLQSHPMRTPQKFWGTFVRKERWGLSWWGWLIVFTGVLVAFSVFSFRVYPFLAVTHRVDTNVLVVEGWIHPYAARTAVEEFNASAYLRVFSTGGPVNGIGGYINDQNTSASVGVDVLRQSGLSSEFIQMVPSHINGRDRTYSSAVALRRWFRDHNVRVKSINVVTENTHARRTRFLFQKAFGDSITVGIIAARNPDYDPKYWWRCSEGVRDVIDESVAYIYAKFFFYPAEASDLEKTGGPSQATR